MLLILLGPVSSEGTFSTLERLVGIYSFSFLKTA